MVIKGIFAELHQVLTYTENELNINNNQFETLRKSCEVINETETSTDIHRGIMLEAHEFLCILADVYPLPGKTYKFLNKLHVILSISLN